MKIMRMHILFFVGTGVGMLNSESSEASRGQRAAVTARSGLDPQTEGKAGPAGK